MKNVIFGKCNWFLQWRWPKSYTIKRAQEGKKQNEIKQKSLRHKLVKEVQPNGAVYVLTLYIYIFFQKSRFHKGTIDLDLTISKLRSWSY